MFPDYPFTSNFFDKDGHRLHYVDEGDGPVIVMVHGNPTWSYYYRNLISMLRSDYRVIAIDHIGCGLSDKPGDYPYCLSRHIENLESLLDHLSISRFSVVVHDWGGAIGMGCAVKRVQDVDKVILMNTAAFRSRRIPLRIQVCRIPIIGEIIVRLFNGFAWPAQFMAVVNRMLPETASAYLAPYNSWKNRVAIFRFVEDIPMHAGHRSYNTLVEIEQRLPLLRSAHIPLLILWGGQDFCFNDQFYEGWKRRFPEAESHYFKDGGHYILEDKFKEIGPIIHNFLTR
ncbi:MAG: alpha/beta fold hydrolase [Desulforhopalus sp.]